MFSSRTTLKERSHQLIARLLGATSEPITPVSSSSQLSINERELLLNRDNLYNENEYVEPEIPAIYGSMAPIPDQIPQNPFKGDDRHTTEVVQIAKNEAYELFRLGVPTVFAYVFQSSEQFSTVFSLGHLGKEELAASSLATMTAAISAFSIFMGVISSLDTLATQAFGAGRPQNLVIYLQRCLFILALLHIPIAFVWLNLEKLLLLIHQDPQVATLCGRYMKVFIFGSPGYAIFEALKRYLQAQGIFAPITVTLAFAAPLNLILNYLLVWSPVVGFGFLGAPTAVVITYWFQATALVLYVRFSSRPVKWTGFTKRALCNLYPMMKLAFYGVLMIATEWAAYELTSLGASFLGTVSLAAQSIMLTTTSLAYQIPFAFSVASSARVGNLVGSGHANAARICTRVATMIALTLATINSLFFYTCRYHWGSLFSSDPDVLAAVTYAFPVLCCFVIFDAMSAIGGGILRGMGKQNIGGPVSIISNYCIAIPLACVFVIVFHLGLRGIWYGMIIGIGMIVLCEYIVIARANWKRIILAADKRLSTA